MNINNDNNLDDSISINARFWKFLDKTKKSSDE
jgi:hypothetical protein